MRVPMGDAALVSGRSRQTGACGGSRAGQVALPVAECRPPALSNGIRSWADRATAPRGRHGGRLAAPVHCQTAAYHINRRGRIHHGWRTPLHLALPVAE